MLLSIIDAQSKKYEFDKKVTLLAEMIKQSKNFVSFQVQIFQLRVEFLIIDQVTILYLRLALVVGKQKQIRPSLRKTKNLTRKLLANLDPSKTHMVLV